MEELKDSLMVTERHAKQLEDQLLALQSSMASNFGPAPVELTNPQEANGAKDTSIAKLKDDMQIKLGSAQLLHNDVTMNVKAPVAQPEQLSAQPSAPQFEPRIWSHVASFLPDASLAALRRLSRDVSATTKNVEVRPHISTRDISPVVSPVSPSEHQVFGVPVVIESLSATLPAVPTEAPPSPVVTNVASESRSPAMTNWRESRGSGQSPSPLGTIAELSPEAAASGQSTSPPAATTPCISKPDTSDLSLTPTGLRDAHMLQQIKMGATPAMAFHAGLQHAQDASGHPAAASTSLTRMPSRLPQSLERSFELVTDHNDLGEGSFAIVRRIRDKRNQRIFALKVMEKHPLLIRNMVQQVHREVKLQSACRHPNILRLFDFLEDDTHIYMLLEYAGMGGLADLMARSPGRRLTEVHGGWIFGQVVDGVAYLHSKGTIHRDLKPDNILFDEMFVAKVCDFGWCADLGEGSSRKTTCGTLDYMAPEVLMSESHGVGVDLWSLGILLYEMLCGHTPFAPGKARRNSEEFVNKVLAVEYPFPPWLSNEACHLVHCQLQRNASHRPQCTKMLQHAWLVKYYHQPKQQNRPPKMDNLQATADANAVASKRNQTPPSTRGVQENPIAQMSVHVPGPRPPFQSIAKSFSRPELLSTSPPRGQGPQRGPYPTSTYIARQPSPMANAQQRPQTSTGGWRPGATGRRPNSPPGAHPGNHPTPQYNSNAHPTSPGTAPGRSILVSNHLATPQQLVQQGTHGSQQPGRDGQFPSTGGAPPRSPRQPPAATPHSGSHPAHMQSQAPAMPNQAPKVLAGPQPQDGMKDSINFSAPAKVITQAVQGIHAIATGSGSHATLRRTSEGGGGSGLLHTAGTGIAPGNAPLGSSSGLPPGSALGPGGAPMAPGNTTMPTNNGPIGPGANLAPGIGPNNLGASTGTRPGLRDQTPAALRAPPIHSQPRPGSCNPSPATRDQGHQGQVPAIASLPAQNANPRPPQNQALQRQAHGAQVATMPKAVPCNRAPLKGTSGNSTPLPPFPGQASPRTVFGRVTRDGMPP